jgi:hypothetical protein
MDHSGDDPSLRGAWRKDGGASFTGWVDPHTGSTEVSPTGDVNVEQAAMLLEVSCVSVHRWIWEGMLVVVKTRPMLLRISQVRKLASERGQF